MPRPHGNSYVDRRICAFCGEKLGNSWVRSIKFSGRKCQGRLCTWIQAIELRFARVLGWRRALGGGNAI